MKNWILFLVFIWIMPGNTLNAQLSREMEIKVTMTLQKVWKEKKLSLITVQISPQINESLPVNMQENSVLLVREDDKILGIVLLSEAKGRYDYFDYLVLFKNDLSIAFVDILVYRSDYGGQINNQQWMKQFQGKTGNLIYKKDVDGVSGASFSAPALVEGVNQLAKVIHILRQQKLL